MTPEQTAGAVRVPVVRLGSAFAEDPGTLRRARELGLTAWAFYVAGRGGALGDVRSDTVAAAIGLIAPDAVYDGWEAARRVSSPTAVAQHHLMECCRWGVEVLTDLPSLPRVVELADRVVRAADPAGMPLFAAWRSMPVLDDRPGARVAAQLHLLREHRDGAHLLAIRAAALSPLEAVITGPEGEAGAVTYGWPPPYPPFQRLMRKRAFADALTDRIAGEAYRCLDVAERLELVSLLESLLAGVDDRTGEYPTVA